MTPENSKLLRLFSFSAREFVAGARKKSVSKFTDSLEKLDFMVSDYTAASKKINATASSLAIPAERQVLTILMLDDVKFGKLIAGEAHKFFLASMVSLERSKQEQQHNLAWQVVEHYYAAYYAVHYLMRVSGFSLTNIDEKALKAIKKSTTVPLEGVSGGLNTLEFSQDCKDIIIRKNEKGGGSHKEAWAIWVCILERLIVECRKDNEEYSSLEIELIAHRQFISVNDYQYNPSDIRAEVNYQFKGDSWCFEESKSSRISALYREIISDGYTLTSTEDKITNLINNNKFIIRLAKLFFEHSRKEYSKGICRSLHNQFKNKISTLS